MLEAENHVEDMQADKAAREKSNPCPSHTNSSGDE
jgi:hypothetical protein